MEKPAPSLKDLWVKGDLFTRLFLAACALFWVWVLYSIRIWNLLDSEHGVMLVLGGLTVWGAYRVGVEIGSERVYQRFRADAEERQRRIEAARPPEERAAIEQKRLREQIRDQVVFSLTPEDRAVFAVVVPNDPKYLAMEQRVEREVERILTERSASAPKI